MIAAGGQGMSAPLKFRFDLEKMVNALAYFAAKRVPGLTTLKAAKLLYLADRRHLLTHGRPITGDRYVAMDLGPVPEGSYQLISRIVAKDEIDDPTKECLVEHLRVNRGFWGTLKYPTLTARKQPDPIKVANLEAASRCRTRCFSPTRIAREFTSGLKNNRKIGTS